ncbi:amino acid adenylation domain-containing protein [Nostoc sp.]|uniref:amino acid adenylation domain-containing protein n=1 Tax=Nostoc sp. TaxID=1180 RepID=UPI002FFAEF2D
MQTEVIEGYRLSPQQMHLWSLQQFEPTVPYRAQFAFVIEGNLNQNMLEVALQKVVNRHEILRTNFCCLPGMTIPLQAIADSSMPSVNYHDFSKLDVQEQNSKIQVFFEEVLKLPLNFQQGSLLHISLITLAENKYILLISLPTLCADEATIINLMREISYLYGESWHEKELDAEPTQYADVAEWQNQLLEAEEAQARIKSWCKHDLSIALALKLPLENHPNCKLTFQPQFLSLNINIDLLKKLEILANKYKSNTSNLLLSCWLVLLWQLTGEQNIIIGKTGDGRKYEELEQALGLFAKYLPLTCHLDDKFQFIELLNKVDESVKEAYKLQDYFSWDKVIELSDDIKSELFPFCFDFSEQPQNYCINDLSFSVLQHYVYFDRFKVKLYCIRRDDVLNVEFHYDSALYDLKVIERLASQFQTLLESAVNRPEAAIGKLNILNLSERQQLLGKFNQTQIEYPQVKCIHHLFEEQANSTPNNVAVVFEDKQITHAQLNAKANQLAHYLQRLGVGKEVLVGLLMERSLEVIVAILAILKAGGAYLPLDPALPKEGLALRLQEAQVSLVISNSSLVIDKELLTKGQNQLICLDTDWEAIAQEPDNNPSSEVQPQNLVYVLFTSGSTGKPKGVAVEHQQLFNYVNAIRDRLDLSVCTSFAIVSTFAADLGNTVIFSSLCSGGCLYVVSSERAINPESLAEYFHRHPVDCLKIVPSHLSALITSSRAAQILPRQRLILGGEACSWELIAQIQQLASECLIFNHYGPTEATVGVLTYPIKQGQTVDCSRSQTVPLGCPIANTQIYLLDSYLQPVPIGTSGELYIGGAGVARGYLNQPDLTDEKFILHSFGDTEAIASRQRLYKTGDLARYLPDGNIEFLGRIDHQVKIHGFRIELGEIEAALRQHPAVREIVVLAREEQPGNKCLLAYIVPEKQSIPTTTELRGFLQEKLPQYMVPSTFVRLKALPLLPNGKVDRQALPVPDSRFDLKVTFVTPRTTTEKLLAGIWAEILRLEQVGIDNNFFELGGDSILSMQIIARANQAGLQLTPKQLFEHQTIAELAAVVGINKAIQAEQGLVTGTVPLTPIQHWFFEQNFPQIHHWNQAVLLEVRQALDPVLLEQAVQQLLKHHDVLRLRYNLQESGWQQINADFDEVVPLTLLNLSTLSEIEQKLAISAAVAELHSSLNLSSGPLLRIALLDLGSTKSQRLLMIIHHLVVDGVSWRVLLEDLQTAYKQLTQGETMTLPPKTTSFKHWAERLQGYVQSQALQQELDYWLSEVPGQIDQLPVDFPSGDNTVARANSILLALSQQETQALLQEVSAVYQTQINDVLLTALVQAVEQWTGARSLLVDLEGHGREEIFDDVDLSRTVGWFSTIFPVFLDIRECSRVEDALKSVKNQLRNVPNRGIGYGLLRYLGDEKAVPLLPYAPKAEIRFNYLGQSDQIFQDSSLFVPAQESTESGRSLQSSRSYLLDVNGIVAGGQLQINWTYSSAIHHRTTIERLAENFIEALREIIAHCQSLRTARYLSVPQTEPSTTTRKISVEVLNTEAVLDSTIRPQTSFEYKTEPTHIFLTGATGFVGAFLLDELLQQTNASIYCLVRAANAESGNKKLQSHLESYLLWNKSLSDRIIPVVGDLSKPLLGLSVQQFQVMAELVDVIYHNAAAINLVYPYSALKAINVLGTQEVLRLASQFKVKPVHYISTLSVLSSKEHAQVKGIRELHNFSHSQIPSGGYAQTKWVAEKLVTTAHNRGIPASIYRLGRVSGHSKTGVCNTSDRLYRMLKGFIQLRSAPDVDTTVDMTPVDYVTRAIVHLSRQKKSLDQIFHLSNRHPINSFELFDWIREFGYSLQPMSDNQWQTELVNASEVSLDNPLYPLIPFFAGMEAEGQSKQESSEEISHLAALKFNCQNTTDGLADTSIVCPPVDAKLLSTYFSYLIESGFLNAPQKMLY